MIKFQSPYQTILIELLSFYPTLLLLCSNFQVESLDHNFLKFIIPKLDKTVHRSYSNLSGSSELFVNCLHFRLVTIKREKLCLLVSSYILILLSVQLVMFTGVLWMPEWLKLCKLSEHLHGNEDQEWGNSDDLHPEILKKGILLLLFKWESCSYSDFEIGQIRWRQKIVVYKSVFDGNYDGKFFHKVERGNKTKTAAKWSLSYYDIFNLGRILYMWC